MGPVAARLRHRCAFYQQPSDRKQGSMMQEDSGWLIAFGLIYLTFFLDNVLLTVLVPIIPEWVSGASLAEWGARGEAPLARALNATLQREHAGAGAGGAQAAVGLVLSAKALAQLACAGPAAAAVCRRGPAAPLRAGCALLLLAALVFAGCGRAGGRAACACAGAGRAAHGAGAALSGVAGLALAARVTPPPHAERALGALLGAVALGVLVGYPFGGATYALWSPEVPFLIIAVVIFGNLVLQYKYLWEEKFNQPSAACGGWGWRGALAAARRAPCAACAGAVLLSTCVMAALEPCLPLWIRQRFHPQRWVSGGVFVPDSAAYALSASTLGGAARALGAERVALAGMVGVALAALALPHAPSVAALAGPHVLLGAGLGAVDAALVPALLARAGDAPHRAALLHAAASAAYALGPIAGGLVSWWCGFESALRALGVLNLLYAAVLCRALRRAPLSAQWGALSEDEESGEVGEVGELAPLRHNHIATK